MCYALKSFLLLGVVSRWRKTGSEGAPQAPSCETLSGPVKCLDGADVVAPILESADTFMRVVEVANSWKSMI